MDNLGFASLKARQREIRSRFPESLSLRVHRALSWLKRAEQEDQDGDACFIFLWIAFNAAYANQINDRHRFTERRLFLNFLGRLIDSDREQLLYHLVWDQFSDAIRLLIDNKFVYQPFWDYHNGLIAEVQWQARFERSKASAYRALGNMNTRKLMAVMFDRLYVLRNQLVHGGATWNSAVNRLQVAQCVQIMGRIVPTVIHLIMKDSRRVWGDACYPVVD